MWGDMTIAQPYLYALMALLLPAMLFDIRQHRVPNWLTLPFWLIGIVLHIILGGWSGFLDSSYGLLLMLALMLPFYLVGLMGAGDVKLMTAVGAIVGIDATLQVALGIVITGFFMSVAILAKQRLFPGLLTRMRSIIGASIADRRAAYQQPTHEQKQLVLPYAVPITFGTLIALMVMSAMK